MVKPLVLVVVVGGLFIIGAYAEGQARTPTDDACITMLDYQRSASGGENASNAWDRLRYVEGRLDKATAPEAVAIREYLAYDRAYRGGRIRPTGPVPKPDDAGPADDVGLAPQADIGHRLLVGAAQACTGLGHPELQEFLYDQTGDVDYAPQ